MADKVLLTVREAADALSLGKTATYELIASRRLRSVVVGRARRVPADALAEFAASLGDDDDNTPDD